MSTPEQKKIAADCWKRGNEAVPKENWDYAIQMYSTSVKFEPDNLMFRQSLRFTEYKKYGDNRTGAKMAGMRLMGVRGRIKKCRMGKDWKGVAEAAEEGLTVNPWDAQLNADLGDACVQLGFQEVAVFSYTESLKIEPTNVAVNKALGLLLEERGEYSKAAECWERILKVDPNNGEARSKITGLHTQKVLDRGGYEGAGSTRDVSKGVVAGSVKGKAADAPGQSVEADLQRAIRKEPANKDNYTKLADYYRREGKIEEAEKQLQQALAISGNNVNIREMLEDVQIELMKKAHEISKEHVRKKPEDPALKERAGALAVELLKREIENLASRVERYPQDQRLKFELGSRYMRVQKWALASRSDPRLKGPSLVNLGKCFFYDKKHSLARRQFESAIPEINYDEQPDMYKDLFYSLGRLCEELKDGKAAEDYYQKVLEIDYSYKDAVARLDALQGGVSGGEPAA
jgi:tetratricopeptide (TPR) repeat protein